MKRNNHYNLGTCASWEEIEYSQDDKMTQYFAALQGSIKNGIQYIYMNIGPFSLFLYDSASRLLFEPITDREILMTGLYGHLNNTAVFVSKYISPGVITLSKEKINFDLLHCFFMKYPKLNVPVINWGADELPALIVSINDIGHLNKLTTLI